MTEPEATAIEAALAAVARPERAEHEKAYLKSDLEHLGASGAHRAAALTVREAVKPLSEAQRNEILAARRA